VDVGDHDALHLVLARDVVGEVEGPGVEREFLRPRGVIENEAACEELVVGYLIAFGSVSCATDFEDETAQASAGDEDFDGAFVGVAGIF
jgi:hypothetical protein